MVWAVDHDRLAAVLRSADGLLVVLALLAALVANVMSAWRWQRIAHGLRLEASLGWCLRHYLQAITLNSLLPGGILGGDVYRGLALTRHQRIQAHHHGLGIAAGHSVLLERVSGLWGLGWVSLLCLPLAFWALPSGRLALAYEAYALGLVALALLPLLAAPTLFLFSRLLPERLHQQPLVQTLLQGLPLMRRTLMLSMVMQVFSILAFGLCLEAVGLRLSPALVGFLACGIFLTAVMPAALGGFGARELGALAFFTGIADPALVLAGSLLFGLLATGQGLLGGLLWLLPQDRHPARP